MQVAAATVRSCCNRVTVWAELHVQAANAASVEAGHGELTED